MRKSPLQWPQGWLRVKGRKAARFDTSLDKATRELLREIEHLGGKYAFVTHDAFRRGVEPADPGVAVYFSLKGQQRVFACDRWLSVRDNIRAIGKTIEALRGIERWGASEMMERAFSAFQALAAPSWRKDLEFAPSDYPDLAKVEARYRKLVRRWHPDAPEGNAEQFKRITDARDRARAEFGRPSLHGAIVGK